MSSDSASIETNRPLGRWLALGVLLTVITASVMVALIGVDELADAMASLSPIWLVIALCSEAVALACLTRVYAAIFRAVHGPLPAREATTVALGSFTLSQLLPGGGAAGAVFAAHRLSRRSNAVTGAAAAVLFGIISMIALGLIISVGATVSAVSTGQHRSLALIAGIFTGLLFVALLVGVWILSEQRRRHAIVDRIASWTRRDDETRIEWQTALDDQHDLLRRPTRLLPALLWSAAYWSFDMGVLAAIAVAAGLDLPGLAIVVAYGVANLANAIPVTPGGIGLVEAGITGALVAMGAPASGAALVALGYRLAADLLPMVIAAPIALGGLRAPPDLGLDSGPDEVPPAEDVPSTHQDLSPDERPPTDGRASTDGPAAGPGAPHSSVDPSEASS